MKKRKQSIADAFVGGVIEAALEKGATEEEILAYLQSVLAAEVARFKKKRKR
jgi:alkylhydroperoxidase/carboxymuconolactone decarboxylase family protein YurZ